MVHLFVSLHHQVQFVCKMNLWMILFASSSRSHFQFFKKNLDPFKVHNVVLRYRHQTRVLSFH